MCTGDEQIHFCECVFRLFMFADVREGMHVHM